MVRDGLGKGRNSSLKQEVESLRRRVAELDAAESRHASAEKQILELNADLKRTFDDAPIGLCYLDADLRYVHINEWLAQLNGLPVAAHLGKTIGEVLPDVASGVELQFQQVLTTGQPIIAGTVEAETPAHPGVTRTFEHYYYADVGADGASVGVRCVVLDVTQRRQDERSLRRWAHIFEHAEMAVVVSAPDGTIELVNPAAARMYGTSAERLVSKNIAHLYATQVRKQVARYSRRANTEDQVSFESKHTRQDGTVFDVQVTATAVRDAQGEVSYRVANIEDITERKALETRRLEAEATRHREALAHMSRISTLGELSPVLAHEISQPLTAILTNAQAALRFLESDEPDLVVVKDILADIVAADKRAGAVIQRLRGMMVKEESKPELLDLNTLVEDVVLLVKSEFIIKNVAISVDLQPGLPVVQVDRVHVQQVLVNLITNAIQVMAERECDECAITLTTRANGGQGVEVLVSDTGPGIDQGQVDRLFEPFFSSKRDGLGMGLPISRSLVEIHGGRLQAVNNPQGGATFSFTIPVPSKG